MSLKWWTQGTLINVNEVFAASPLRPFRSTLRFWRFHCANFFLLILISLKHYNFIHVLIKTNKDGFDTLFVNIFMQLAKPLWRFSFMESWQTQCSKHWVNQLGMVPKHYLSYQKWEEKLSLQSNSNMSDEKGAAPNYWYTLLFKTKSFIENIRLECLWKLHRYYKLF